VPELEFRSAGSGRPRVTRPGVATLVCMSHYRVVHLVLAVAIAACLVGWPSTPVAALPSAAQTAADRARVDRALEALESARVESARIDARAEEASAELDGIVAEQQQVRDRLRSRANFMYRTGSDSFVSVLLGARTFEEFVERWDLLMRMNRQDADDIRTLQAARIQAEESANALMALQAEQAKAIDAIAAEVDRARKELAASEAALAEYNAGVAEQAKQAAAPKPSDSTQQLHGSGEWQTAVASHYGLSFTGRGASGEEIGPYSMIVAHRTLPFGTLIEFEYNGKRAVARVADRGPHTEGREFDLGPGVVRVLDFSGVDEVRYRIITQ